VLEKKLENCETCPIALEDGDENECLYCQEHRRSGASLHPSTGQLLRIRRLAAVGYPFRAEDLASWQWEALGAIEDAIEERKAEEIRRSGGKKPSSISGGDRR